MSVLIYVLIDDNLLYEQYKNQIVLYLWFWELVIGYQWIGVYVNFKIIDWVVNDGLGLYFWQYNWGLFKGYIYLVVYLYQVEIDKCKVGGVGVDVN